MHLNIGTAWAGASATGHKLNFDILPYRRQRLAQKLMNDLEDITEEVHKAYFVDLFVRVTNATAIQMYNKVSHCLSKQLLSVMHSSVMVP